MNLTHACHLVPCRPDGDGRYPGTAPRLWMTYCDCGWGSNKLPTEASALRDFRVHVAGPYDSKPDFDLLQGRISDLRSAGANLAVAAEAVTETRATLHEHAEAVANLHRFTETWWKVSDRT